MDILNFDQLFDGYCPESKLSGKSVRMRLNANDFYESEATGLQIAVSYPGVQAAVLKQRGSGKFKNTVSYADSLENGELLSPQQSERFPFCSDDVFADHQHFAHFLEQEVEKHQIGGR